MDYIGLLSFILSVLGAYRLALYLRFLLPRNAIPLVSARLDDTVGILTRAEADDALPNANEYRISVAIYRIQLLQLRMASHRSPWFGQQLRLAIRFGLTWRVYSLHLQIADLRRELEMAMGEHQLASLATVPSAESAATAVLATPAAIIANVTELPSPLPAAVVNPS